MPFLHNDVFDNGLNELDANAEDLLILDAEPTSYADIGVGANELGNKATPVIDPPADRGGGGRQLTVQAFSDGSVTASGTATHWAIVDDTNSRLLAADALSSSQGVTNGNTFSLPSFEIGIPDPV